MTDAALRGINPSGVEVPVKVDANSNLALSAFAAVTFTHTAVNATTSDAQVLAANANRKYLLVINDSDTVIYLMVGGTAVANQGIRLNANGGNFEMSLAMGNLSTAAIRAIHAGTGNKALLFTEGV